MNEGFTVESTLKLPKVIKESLRRVHHHHFQLSQQLSFFQLILFVLHLVEISMCMAITHQIRQHQYSFEDEEHTN